LPLLNNGGSIVNISSGTTRFCNPGYSIYASMKGAVETFTKYLANITALGRVGEANDIGGIVAFLCSKDGYWINGQRIEASGGISL